MTMNIPDLSIGPIVETDGYPSDTEWQFRQNLVQSLQSVTSDEGLVPPTQNTANITIIQNGKDTEGNFTCQGGTLIYNSDTNELQVCILVGGVPSFRNVTHS